MQTYNVQLINNLRSGDPIALEDTLRLAGFGVDEVATAACFPTQVEGTDPQGRPFYFRLRSNLATFMRGVRGERWYNMLADPEVEISVDVPEGYDESTIWNALLTVADEAEKANRGQKVRIIKSERLMRTRIGA